MSCERDAMPSIFARSAFAFAFLLLALTASSFYVLIDYSTLQLGRTSIIKLSRMSSATRSMAWIAWISIEAALKQL
jgi:hypothetical protein